MTYPASPATNGWVRFRYSTPSGTGSSNRAADLVAGVADQLAGGAGDLAEVEPDVCPVPRDDRPERPQRVGGEPGDVHARADRVADGRQLAADLLDLDRLLGEHRAGPLLAVGGGLPVAEQGVALGLEVAEGEERLLGGAERPRSRSPSITASSTWLVFAGTGTETPSRAADRLVLAEQDVEHDPVDLVVEAVVGQRPGRSSLGWP